MMLPAVRTGIAMSLVVVPEGRYFVRKIVLELLQSHFLDYLKPLTARTTARNIKPI
jgi:hypothetical protein